MNLRVTLLVPLAALPLDGCFGVVESTDSPAGAPSAEQDDAGNCSQGTLSCAPPTGARCVDVGVKRMFVGGDDTGNNWCECQDPEGDPFWACTLGHTVCPVTAPEDGTACVSVPRGLRCFFEGIGPSCACTGWEPRWSCE